MTPVFWTFVGVGVVAYLLRLAVDLSSEPLSTRRHRHSP
jgi:hypothetical protein